MKHERILLDRTCARGDKRRSAVSMLCEVRQGARAWQLVRLDDLSPSGFRIARFPNVSPSMDVRIRIPGIQLLNAKVRWQDGAAVGCEFTTPLHVAVFDHILANGA